MTNNDNLPPLNWLRSFEACARLGSFTAAGKELNITQPAVSHQIRLLENFLKRSLFLRDGRTKRLTDAGHDYIHFVREAFDLLRFGSRTVFDPEQGQSLTLRSNMAFTQFWLMPRLKTLYSRHPWIRLNILPHISDTEERPSNFEIEILSLINHAQKDFRPLRDEYFFPVCAPILAEGSSFENVHLFDSSSMTATWETWHDSEFNGPPASPVNISSTVVVSLSAAINGIGLALAHTSLYEAIAKTGQLIRPFEGKIKMQERYFVSEPTKDKRTPAGRAFIEWLDEQIVS